MNRKKNSYILDSYAFFVYLNDEKNADILENLFYKAEKKEIELFLPLINYGEILYHLLRTYSQEEAEKISATIQALPISLLEIDMELVIYSAQVKAKGKISLADSYVIAAAKIRKATVVTGDKEFKPFEKDCSILWL